jgi:glycosyltransferase involved in cell wall biosynthesis
MTEDKKNLGRGAVCRAACPAPVANFPRSCNMRVLIDHPSPFLLAHGGFQLQIEQTAAALRASGIKVEFLRWWDDAQRGDLIHFFGRPTAGYVEMAQNKGMKVVVADLLTGLGSRSYSQRLIQRALTGAARRILPASFTARLAWDAFKRADALIALTPWEAHLMHEMFGACESKIHVVPNGVEEVFMNTYPRKRGPWLVCTATITERKRVLELAQAAVEGQTPVWIIGKPYSSADPYAMRFEQLAKANPQWIRYEGPIHNRAKLAEIYREARGFVLLSTMESLSLSALEAAACECPLLLSDLPWARTVFGERAAYCSVGSITRTTKVLRQFYNQAAGLALPPKPLTWAEVAKQLRVIYEGLLSTSR